MKRVSDLLVLAVQIVLGYTLVHFASPWTDQIAIKILAFAIFLLAAFVGIKALLDLGTSFAVAPTPHSNSKFVARGIYSKIRHPMYLSVLLAALALLIAGLNLASLISFIGIAIFFALKIQYEEKALQAKFPDYLEYKRKTGRLLPKL